MHHAILAIALAGSAHLLAVLPAAAMAGCTVGQRVKTPGGKLATVTAVAGSGCTIKADGEPFTNTYGAFMLDPASGTAAKAAAATSVSNAAAGSAPVPGLYQCTSSTAGNMKLRILGGGRYSNEQGSVGTYTTTSGGRMAFKGGPWDGYYAGTLVGGRIGLSSSPSGAFYAMTCGRSGG